MNKKTLLSQEIIQHLDNVSYNLQSVDEIGVLNKLESVIIYYLSTIILLLLLLLYFYKAFIFEYSNIYVKTLLGCLCNVPLCSLVLLFWNDRLFPGIQLVTGFLELRGRQVDWTP